MEREAPRKLKIIEFKQIETTMDEAANWPISQFKQDAVIFIAQSQTKGRGQGTNVWMSPPGNLYTTILTKVKLPQVQYLSLLSSYSVVNVIERVCGQVIQMKWINDFFLGKNDKKLGGVLIVNNIVGDDVYSAIGVGVNLYKAPVETATCLREFVDRIPTTKSLAVDITDEILSNLKKDKSEIIKGVQQKLKLKNQMVKIYDSKLIQVLAEGKFLGLNEDGYALLEGYEKPFTEGRMRKAENEQNEKNEQNHQKTNSIQ